MKFQFLLIAVAVMLTLINRAPSLKSLVIKKVITGIIFSCWHLSCCICRLKDLTTPSQQLHILRFTLLSIWPFLVVCVNLLN